MKTQLKTLEIRGLQTAWLQSGKSDRPILFLLHGFPDGPEVWDGFAAAMEERFQVIRPYGRGTGHSAPAKETRRYGTHAESLDLFEILRAVDPKLKRKVVVLGHDLGGILAWAFAAHLGEQLAGLAIINSYSLEQAYKKLQNPAQLKKSWYIGFMQIPGFPELIASRFAKYLHRATYQGVPRDARPSIDLLPANAVHAANRYRALLREGIASRQTRLHRLKAPVFVLFGKHDPFVLPPTTEEIERQCNAPEIRILEAGHWPFLEKPAIVHSLMHQFFDKLVLDAPSRPAPTLPHHLTPAAAPDRARSL